MKTLHTLYISLLAVFALALNAQAQTISFENGDYKAVGVYDSWQDSPFRADTITRQPRLQGNAAVVNNFLKTTTDSILGRIVDSSDSILGFQRSRYGGNLYGVRIYLKEPLRLTKAVQYAHVMTYIPSKPSASKMMLIGLGKRVESEWEWQDGEDEQFWATTASDVEGADKWQDQVFAFQGFSNPKNANDTVDHGIDIYSIVIVPDVATRQDMTEDFICYFDSIVFDNSPAVRFSSDYYALSFSKDQSNTRRGTRQVNSVGLTVDGQTYTAAANTALTYNDLTTTTVFTVRPGQTVTPVIDFTGTWMSAYAYVDWDNNGIITYNVNADGTPAAGSEIVSYNAAQVGGAWTNSTGASVQNGNQPKTAMPSFTVPATQKGGLYRMRFKMDWDCLDPAGNAAESNIIYNNGGGVVDVMLNVQADSVLEVSQGGLNGDVLDAGGNKLDKTPATAGRPFTIRMSPALGFRNGGVRVRYGYNTGSDNQFDKYGNPYWFSRTVNAEEFDDNDVYTLPAEIMIGQSIDLSSDFQSGNKIRKGDTVKALSQLRDSATYLITNVSSGAYLTYNSAVSTENLAIIGITNPSPTHGLPSDAGKAAEYQKSMAADDPNNSFAITREGDSYYLYNIGTGRWVTRGSDGRTYIFTDTKTALDGIRANPNNTFSFHAGGGMSDDSRYFLCISSNNSDNPVVNWRWNDAGAEFYIIENPNLNSNGQYTAIEAATVRPAPAGRKDGAIYDLQGRRLHSLPANGVYIRGGKKYVVK